MPGEMSESFDYEGIARELIKNGCSDEFLHGLRDEHAIELAETLKRLAEEAILDCRTPSESDHWSALECLEYVARKRDSLACLALYYLAAANCSKDQNSYAQTADLLERARQIYAQLGDTVGLVRVDITRAGLAQEKTLDDALIAEMRRQADSILDTPHGPRYRLHLEVNLGAYWCQCGDYQRAQTTLEQAYQKLVVLPRQDRMTALALLWLGNTFFYQMHLAEAIEAYEAAIKHSGHIRRIALVCGRNIAEAELRQTHYSSAIKRLLANLADANAAESVTDSIGARQYLMLCYMGINDHELALQEAEIIGAHYEQHKQLDEAVRVLLERATIETLLGSTNVDHHLQRAEMLAGQWHNQPLLAMTALRRAQLALMNKNHRVALEAVRQFMILEHKAPLADALAARLVLAQVLAAHEPEQARREVETVLHHLNTMVMPELRYQAYITLAQIMERHALPQPGYHQAIRHYVQAMLIIERMQRSLALHLRGDFLRDKESAFQALMRLALGRGAESDANDVAFALKILERWKAHPVLASLADPQAFRLATTPQHTALLQRLNQERGLFYALTDPAGLDGAGGGQEQITSCVGSIRALINQLIEPIQQRVRPPKIAALQQSIGPDEVGIAYYQDGPRLLAIIVRDDVLVAVPLVTPPTVTLGLAAIEQRLLANIRQAAQVNSNSASQSILGQCTQLLGMLHTWLIAPLVKYIGERTRLVIVPYGSLHRLPFHLFYSAGQYLCEEHEILILPTLSLHTRRGPTRTPGMRVLAHSNASEDMLKGRIDEAYHLNRQFGAEVYMEEQATREVLDLPPTQVLHIAAHATMDLAKKHQLLSFIQLADKINILDLLQLRLDYELVTLSGCETGVVDVAAADDLVGLGHSILLAGAGALCASLWQVRDVHWTPTLMELFYAALYAGLSKPAALRQAQCELLRQAPNLHPAFWGAFQLIGDPRPLTGTRDKS